MTTLPPPSALTRVPLEANLRERARDSIQTAILIGELVPGTLYSVRMLSQQLGMSNTPVREAILDLERLGFLRILKNQGFEVTQPDPGQMARLLKIRLLLEPTSIRELAGNTTVADLAELRRLADLVLKDATDGDMIARHRSELTFHRRLIELTNNPELAEIVHQLRAQSRIPNFRDLSRTPELREAAQEHYRIIDAVELGNADRAETLLRDHIGRAQTWTIPSSRGNDASAGQIHGD
jgi:DNA-binding GntR family transcriptional regulator